MISTETKKRKREDIAIAMINDEPVKLLKPIESFAQTTTIVVKVVETPSPVDL